MPPPKRPPPPSPLRQSGSVRPPAPQASGALPVEQATEKVDGGASGPLLLWVGIGVGLVSVLLIGAVIFFVTRPGPAEVAVTPVAPATEVPAPNSEPQSSPTPATVPGTSEETNPQLPEVAPSVPAAQPATAPQSAPPPAPVTTPLPEVAPPNPAPMPMPASTTPMAVTNPATPTRAPPTTSTALDDVRSRNKLLAIPESKDTKRHVLALVQVAKPQDCELTLVGAEEVCPAGTTLKLVKEDPAADERVWNVTIKSSGALSKERTIADFRLKGEELSFQWQRLSGVLPALMFCLLKIDAAGEQELCHLCKPLIAPEAPLKLAERWTIESELPADVVNNTAGLRVEPLALDFPNVTQPGNTTLAPGETAIFKVTGASSGALDVELELECRFELKDGKLQLVITPYAAAPNPAIAERAPKRAAVSPATIKRRKGELTIGVNHNETQVKSLKSRLDRLEQDEKSLRAVVPMNNNQRNAQAQQLLQIRQQINQVEPMLEEAEGRQEALADAAAWFTDMFALLEQLQMQAKFGFRLFRTIGNERIVIAEPPPGPS